MLIAPTCVVDSKELRPETAMTNERSRYLAYLLRLWQVRDHQEMIWRASLESPHTGQRHGFADLDALFEFLETEMSSPGEPAEKSEKINTEDSFGKQQKGSK